MIILLFQNVFHVVTLLPKIFKFFILLIVGLVNKVIKVGDFLVKILINIIALGLGHFQHGVSFSI